MGIIFSEKRNVVISSFAQNQPLLLNIQIIHIGMISIKPTAI